MKIGFTELIVVCVVALLVLGPDKLPIYAKKLGQALRDLSGVTGDIAKEINESVVEPLNEVAQPLKDAADEITQPLNDVKKSIESIGKVPKEKPKETEEEADGTRIAEETAAGEETDPEDTK